MDAFASLIQERIANVSVNHSSARNMGPAGTIAAAREFLTDLKLSDFTSRKNFNVALEAATLLLKSYLPKGARHWGSSRKFLNLFLAEATYNHYLRQQYKLEKIEDLLELPLDSFCARRLKQEDSNLPRWGGVIHLLPQESQRYQTAASHIAKRLSCCRIHLDLMYWRNLRMNEAGA